MIHRIFTIFDIKAEAYLPPFFLPTRGVAIRGFAEAASNPEHNFGKYPADYTLFELGSFNDNDANIVMHSSPQSIGNGLDLGHALTIVEAEKTELKITK